MVCLYDICTHVHDLFLYQQVNDAKQKSRLVLTQSRDVSYITAYYKHGYNTPTNNVVGVY